MLIKRRNELFRNRLQFVERKMRQPAIKPLVERLSCPAEQSRRKNIKHLSWHNMNSFFPNRFVTIIQKGWNCIDVVRVKSIDCRVVDAQLIAVRNDCLRRVRGWEFVDEILNRATPKEQRSKHHPYCRSFLFSLSLEANSSPDSRLILEDYRKLWNASDSRQRRK